ncbi:YadA-like family protein [Photobacterium leiognathi]|uniref:YadA-like family protein n=1 Tax=Photobacterium leiognathi TaxID=553611 RepID=UPI002980C62C|nr:YadA-like family protein [Photobacterium leiognathi]
MNRLTKQLLCSTPLLIACSVHAAVINNEPLAQPQSLTQSNVNNNTNHPMGGNIVINQSTSSPLPNGQYQNTVIGTAPTITGSHNVGIGSGVNVGHYSLAVGDYSHAKDNSEAFGTSSNSLDNGVAIGNQSYANHALAIGAHAYATNNSIAIGNDSRADEKDTVSFGGKVNHQTVVDGKVQVTTTDVTRRLTNVTAGINATDAVNVSQLTEAKNTLQGEITHNSQNISNNSSEITRNTNDIKTNMVNIEQNNQAIDINKNIIANNANNIGINKENINKNITNIQNNTQNITTNSKQISQNTAGINDNKTVIINNGNGIQKNRKYILNNTNLVNKNTQTITNNTNNIQQNTSNINNNKTNIADNSQSIEKNTAGVSTNAYNISHLHNESISYTNNHVMTYYNKSKQYTDEKAQQTLQNANSYTDQRVNQLSNVFNEKLKNLQNREDAGIASAMAMAAITAKPNRKYNIGMGLGYYGDQDAIAMAAKINTSPDSIVTLDTSYNSNHNVGVAAGMTFGFN